MINVQPIDSKTLTMNCEEVSIKKNRKLTDLAHFIIFNLLLMFYTGMCIYAFCACDFSKISNDFQESLRNKTDRVTVILNLIHNARYTIIGFSGLALILFVLTMFIMPLISKFAIFIGCLEDYAFILVTAVGCIFYSFTFGGFSIRFIVLFGLLLFCGIIKYYLIKEVGLTAISQILQESCRIILKFPSSILLSFFACFFEIVILFCAVVVLIFLISTQILLVRTELSVAFFLGFIINIVMSAWIMVFIHKLNYMILSGIFATWCLADNEQSVPLSTSLRCARTTFMYHWGTLAYSSAPWVIYPNTIVVWSCARANLSEFYKNPFITVYCWLSILIKLEYSSLIPSFIHGTEYRESTRNACNLFMKNSFTYVLTMKAVEWVVAFMLTFVSTIVLLSVRAHLDSSEFIVNSPTIPSGIITMVCIALNTLLLISPFIIVLSAAVETVLCCKFKKSEILSESQSKDSNFRFVQL